MLTGHPIPYPNPLGTDLPSGLANRHASPRNSSQIYAYGYDYWYMYNVRSTDYGFGVTGNYWGDRLNPVLTFSLS